MNDPAANRLATALRQAHALIDEAAGDDPRVVPALGGIAQALAVVEGRAARLEMIIEELERLRHERDRLVERLRRCHQAEQSVSAYADLLAVVSHDLRNPLCAILMNARLLGRATGDERHEKLVQAILRSAERMHRLILDLLDLARIEAGQITLERRPHEAEPLVVEALELVEPLAAQKGLRLEHTKTPGLPEVLCDRERVLQVLSNLLGNAIKFTPEGGSITVSLHARTGEIEFAVRDSGVGIDREALPHVFDRFWQASHNSRKGVGLGLSIVKGIVEAHGGRIWVRSQPGAGSTFCFTLPTRLSPARRDGA